MEKYWIIVASRDHVQLGKAGGFMQACHGKMSALKRIKEGDWIIYYSPKITYGEMEPCQAFTAIGQVDSDHIYQVSMTPTFHPFRRNVTFAPSTDVAIRPLIDQLKFIKDKQRWSAPFRFGMVAIPEHDFLLLKQLMLKEEDAR